MIVRDVPTRKYLPTLPRFEPLILDHTATKYFKECARKYFYRVVLGRKSRKERNEIIFAWGNAVHAFMEELFKSEDFDKAFPEALKKYKAPAPTDTKKDQNIYSVRRLMLVCKEIWDWFCKEKKVNQTKVLGIEQPFNLLLPDGTVIGGRMDQLMQLGGKLWVRDWKTTSKQARFFATGFDPNDQSIRYIYAASVQAGWDPNDRTTDNRKAEGIQFVVIQNMETLSSIKIEVYPITKSSSELLEWVRDQELWYKTLDTFRNLDHWPKTENNCSWCDFREVCNVGSDASREFMLKDKFDLAPWDHENVSQKKTAAQIAELAK